MSRISREQMWMNIAEVVSRRSTCYRRSVGAIIVHDKNILSIGYNGPPSGQDHCSGADCGGDEGCIRSVHAELNAIVKLKPDERELSGKTMFVTESPCPDCALEIIACNFRGLFYMNRYRISDPLHTLMDAGIRCYRMTPSGYIIDEESGRIV